MNAEVDGDVDLQIVDQGGGIPFVAGTDVMELIAGRNQAATLLAAVVDAVGYADDLEAVSIVTLQQLSHEIRNRMSTEVC